MVAARELLLDRGCPKINLRIRSGNDNALRCFKSIGYSDDSMVPLGLRLIPDE